MVRTMNADKIDIKVADSKNEETIILTGESKDYDGALNLQNVKDIILRIPLNSKLHIILTNELQVAYFTKFTYEKWNLDTRDSNKNNVNKSKTFSKEEKETELEKINAEFLRRSNLIFVKVLTKSKLCLESIRGLPCHLETGSKERCIVIFIETRGDMRSCLEKRERDNEESNPSQKKTAKLDVTRDQQKLSTYDFDDQ